MNFCRSCGTDLRGSGAFDAASDWMGPTQPKVAQSDPDPGAPRKRPISKPPGAHGDTSNLVRCARCGSNAPGGHMFCPNCGAQLPTLSGAPTPDEVKRVTAGREEFRPPDDSSGADSAHQRSPTPSPELSEATEHGPVRVPVVREGARSAGAEKSWGKLVSVNRDGSDGISYYLSGESVDIGSDSPTVRLTGDPHVAPRHARFKPAGATVSVTPLDEVNGVFWRVREPTEVLSGTVVLLGREVCRIDILGAGDRTPDSLSQHGVELFASPSRSAWGRLMHLLSNGTIGDVRLFHADEVVVGREEGDIIFSHDEFMSRRHAVFRLDGNRCILEDLGSSNGTFVRLDASQVLAVGDYLRIGDHMFRFESVP